MRTTDLFGLNHSRPSLYGSFLYHVVFSLTLWTGCTSLELPRAFEGEFNAKKNNKVIKEYCTGCHTHKEFDSVKHVLEVRPKYKKRLFRQTVECRVCHYIEQNWAYNHTYRKTRRP